jgi:CubicO group peptidase (beta-lactamase class C family)
MKLKLISSLAVFVVTTALAGAQVEPPKRLPPRPVNIPETRPGTIQLQDGRQAEVVGNVLHLVLPNGQKTIAAPGNYTTKAGKVLRVEANGIILQHSVATTSPTASPSRQQSPPPASFPKQSASPTTKSSQAATESLKPQAIPSVTRTVGPGPVVEPSVHLSKDKPLPTFRTQPAGEASIQEIDDAVAEIMKLNGVRGAALSIVNGTRLVYAKGYTWAPADYPDVKPTTLFRQASVSKTFTAVATYRLIQEAQKDKTFTLDTTMQSVLQLKTPDGQEPTDPRFSKITIGHLLDMTAGVPADLIWRDVPATQAFKTKLPATPAQVASYCASQKLMGEPGDPAVAIYSNGGMFMLSQVVAKRQKANSFEAALNTLVLKPLGITRVREARSLEDAQLPDEARYHPVPLKISAPTKRPQMPDPVSKTPTAQSVMTPDQPMVTLGYGETNMENCDGAGGLSAAVTDVARLLAALSLRENNPVLDDATVTSMLKNAAADSANPKLKEAWGFHGFDGVGTTDASKGLYWGYKGGDLSTSQNGIYFEREGISYVICWNGLVPDPSLPFYPTFSKVLAAARKHDWGNTDLFPKYGMPSFSAKIGPTAKLPTAVKLPGAGPRLRDMSISRPH